MFHMKHKNNLIKYYNYQLKYYSLNNCNISYKILISPKFANKLISWII